MFTDNVQRYNLDAVFKSFEEKDKVEENKILEISKKCFSLCGSLPAKERLRLMKGLSRFIKDQQSTNCFSGLFSWLITTEEDQILFDCENRINDSKAVIKNLEIFYNGIRNAIIENNKSHLNQLKQVYAKAFEGRVFNEPELKKLEGYNQAEAIQSYLDDLNAFSIKNKNLSKMIESLEFTLRVSILRDEMNYRPGYEPFRQSMRAEINIEILDKIHALEVKNYILLPGGYGLKRISKSGIERTGHSILYRIEKTAKATFSINIINTGQGAESDRFTSAANLIRQRPSVQNYVYKEIPAEKITLDFIDSIARQEFDSSVATPMARVLRPFDTLKVKREFGRPHKQQMRGSCSFKSVAAFISEELTTEEHKNFKSFVRQRQYEKLESLKNGLLFQNLTTTLLKYTQPLV